MRFTGCGTEHSYYKYRTMLGNSLLYPRRVQCICACIHILCQREFHIRPCGCHNLHSCSQLLREFFLTSHDGFALLVISPLLPCITVIGVTALDMTKWFDTNYHNLTPEIDGAVLKAALERSNWSGYLEQLKTAIKEVRFMMIHSACFEVLWLISIVHSATIVVVKMYAVVVIL